MHRKKFDSWLRDQDMTSLRQIAMILRDACKSTIFASLLSQPHKKDILVALHKYFNLEYVRIPRQARIEEIAYINDYAIWRTEVFWLQWIIGVCSNQFLR